MMKKTLFLLLSVVACCLITGCGGNPFGVEDDLLPISQIRPMEDQMLNLLNSARADEGLPALTHHAELRLVARAHSEDMFTREFVNHTNPDGETFADRVDNAGISYTIVGENIAYNSGYTDPVQTAHDSLINSPAHYANIMNNAFNSVGIGIAGDGDKFYFTQVFAHISEPAMRPIASKRNLIDLNPWALPSITFREALKGDGN